MTSFLTWQHLVFLCPIALSVGLVATAAFGSLDLDLDFELDVDLEADADGPASGGGLLGLLGFGRAPLAIVLMSLFATFGGTGLCLQYLLEPVMGRGVLATAIAAGFAFGVSFFGTASLARLIARWLPSTETYATSGTDLIGSLGTVEVRVTREFGVAHVTDAAGTFHQVRCTTDGEALEHGAQILITAYDEESHVYTAERSTL